LVVLTQRLLRRREAPLGRVSSFKNCDLLADSMRAAAKKGPRRVPLAALT
jgi:hypothetical protein